MKRHTYQKMLINTAVSSSKHHPTANDIYTEIREKAPKISMKTVYRNLNELSKDGEIVKISIPGCADRYDKANIKHSHSLCVECGRFDDYFNENLLKITAEALKNEMNFILEEEALVFKGICSKCKNKILKEN